jgi:hypothetical protein
MLAAGGQQQLEVPAGLPPVLHQLLTTSLSKQPEDRCVWVGVGPPGGSTSVRYGKREQQAGAACS